MGDLNRIKEWLLRNGSITPLEASDAFGCMRLSAYIYRLRHTYGWHIETDFIMGRDMHGEPMRYGKYVLKSIPIKEEIDNA